MNVSQLRYLTEIVRCKLNMSRAAVALGTSQPAMSTQLRALEKELGVPIFIRTRNRLVGLTAQGEGIVEVAQNALAELAKIQSIVHGRGELQITSLRIACTHAQARYALPNAVRDFRKGFPGIPLQIIHKHEEELWQLVQNGEADLAITTDTKGVAKGLVYLPCYSMNRSLLAPLNHPILKLRKISLDAIANYPLVTFHEQSSGRKRLMQAFRALGYTPNVTIAAEDEDVIKSFVEVGLGITILASITYDEKRDIKLGARDVTDLLEMSTTGIIVRKSMLAHEPITAFINAFAPKWTSDLINQESDLTN